MARCCSNVLRPAVPWPAHTERERRRSHRHPGGDYSGDVGSRAATGLRDREEMGGIIRPLRRARRRRIPRHLVADAHRRFLALEASQNQRRLLHGDLHHYNVLFDSTRGWLAIDPKGVVGEVEFEIGATLRNPFERPDLFVSPAIVERRLARLARRLNINLARALEWGFAQAVLSAIWSLEDGFTVEADAPVLRLATAIRPMLPKWP